MTASPLPAPPGDAGEQQIARRVAKRVVDRFESVEVDEEQGGNSARRPLRQQPFDLPAKAHPVGQRRYGVVHRKRLNIVQISANLTEEAFDGD